MCGRPTGRTGGSARRRREPQPYGYEQLVADMDRAGVDRAILVPPSFDGDRNDYALEAVRKHPDRFAIMGRCAAQGRPARTSSRDGASSPACWAYG